MITVHDGVDVCVKCLQPNLDLFLRVVSPLSESRCDFLAFGRVERHVIDFSRLRVGPPPNDALHKNLVRDVEENKCIALDAGVGKSVRLGSRPRKPIQQPAFFHAVRLCKPLLDDSNDNIIRDKLSRIHELLGLQPNFRASLGRRPKHVPGAQMNHTVPLPYHFTLCSLSTCWGPGNNKFQAPASLLQEFLLGAVLDLGHQNWNDRVIRHEIFNATYNSCRLFQVLRRNRAPGLSN
mmetsp:Transcript_22577/g.46910  ORF Transcript_22577/g.46910 Transcript_22577/m.46910 type:complete len:236 (-) Transcript_22577:272-979(-)